MKKSAIYTNRPHKNFAQKTVVNHHSKTLPRLIPAFSQQTCRTYNQTSHHTHIIRKFLLRGARRPLRVVRMYALQHLRLRPRRMFERLQTSSTASDPLVSVYYRHYNLVQFDHWRTVRGRGLRPLSPPNFM